MISSQPLASCNKTKDIKQQLFLAFYSKYLLFVVQACYTVHSLSWASQSMLNKLIQHQLSLNREFHKMLNRWSIFYPMTKMDSSSMVGTSVHSSANKLKNGAPRSWSKIYQPILQLTTVPSETSASNTTWVKIICAFLQLICVFLQLTA